MGYSPGGVRFADGQVFFTGVDTTSDTLMPRMNADVPPGRHQAGAWDDMAACINAGHEPEECEAADSGRFTFKAHACRACMLFHGPYALFDDGYGDRSATAEAHTVSRESEWLADALDAALNRAR